MQAYNAEKTLDRPYGKLPQDIGDKVLLVDGGRADQNVEVAKRR